MGKVLKIVGALEGVTVENNLLLAIHRHCLKCMGGNKVDVKNCQGKTNCRLWGYRMGPLTDEETNKSRLLYVINAHCRECIGQGETPESCQTDGSGMFNRCNLFELRGV
jgi:hypothetical protein